jgi:hypothetical protein
MRLMIATTRRDASATLFHSAQISRRYVKVGTRKMT